MVHQMSKGLSATYSPSFRRNFKQVVSPLREILTSSRAGGGRKRQTKGPFVFGFWCCEFIKV